jgi:predicted dehydrogenase
MVDVIHWGIIGTGWIANQFASGLKLLPEAELVAVGSRSAMSAARFGEQFDVPRRYDSYEMLVDDPGVDVVYVATPNPVHKENCFLCLGAGKPVLVEKPFAVNARDAQEVMRLARAKQLFIMEAMWTRFFPAMVELRRLLADRVIGDLQMLIADLSIRFEFDPRDRRFDPELGGGSLLDLGVYPLSLASMIFGPKPPTRLSSLAELGSSGVDEQAAVVLGYDGGRLAVVSSSLRVDSPVEAWIMGSKGRIRIHPWWIKPSQLTVSVVGEEDEVIDMPFSGNGYQFEALEVMSCLKAGKMESDIMPLRETLSTMQTMDEIRGQWGLRYPGEA